jgi:serine/threonine-protein kinase
MDLTAKTCGPYEVWGPISEGGMSRVFLARHKELAAPAILKTLLDTGDAYARLRNEARLTARIPSSRVVRALDVGVYEDTAYLVEEYIDGIDLAELDRRRRAALGRSLPLWFVCSAVASVADGLESAHQTGVLHRDVKPSNIFGSPQTGMRLGDFGIATALGATGERGLGTLRFVAPEALRNEVPTRRWDVYSLGATAFDLYYGRTPFPDLRTILAGEPVVFPEPRRAEEAYFQHVVARMLERDPEKRTPNVKIARRMLGPLGRAMRPQLQGVPIARGDIQVGPLRVRCRLGDIATATTDGIVSSANDEMSMRTGVSDALRARGGDEIEDEARRGGGHALGECIATGAGALACKKVLHAVSAWKEASCIARASQRALLLAEELGLLSLAIPALGTGRAQVAREASAYATASALYWHVLLGGSRLREVTFVLFEQETYDLFVEELSNQFLGEGPELEDAYSSPSAARDLAYAPTMALGAPR